MSRFVVIEGLIGVGKTTLCRLLEKERGARLVLEPCEDNPFLAAFYADKDRYAFPAQMFYLATRYAQQMGLKQTSLFSDFVVSDYLFSKDRLFAEQTLIGDEMALYDRFAGLLSGAIPHPDFILFLDAPTDVVLQRIGRRAIDSESVIPPSYLDELRERYMNLWREYTGAPIYILDTTTINYVDSDEGRTEILDMIDGWLSGRPVEGAPTAFSPVSTPNQLELFAGAAQAI